MKRLIVQIRIEDQVKAEKFEVPAELPLQEMIPHLVQGLGLNTKKGGNSSNYWLESDSGLLDDNKSLAQQGVKNEAMLYLKSGSTLPKAKPKGLKAFNGEFVESKPK